MGAAHPSQHYRFDDRVGIVNGQLLGHCGEGLGDHLYRPVTPRHPLAELRVLGFKFSDLALLRPQSLAGVGALLLGDAPLRLQRPGQLVYLAREELSLTQPDPIRDLVAAAVDPSLRRQLGEMRTQRSAEGDTPRSREKRVAMPSGIVADLQPGTIGAHRAAVAGEAAPEHGGDCARRTPRQHRDHGYAREITLQFARVQCALTTVGLRNDRDREAALWVKENPPAELVRAFLTHDRRRGTQWDPVARTSEPTDQFADQREPYWTIVGVAGVGDVLTMHACFGDRRSAR